VLRAPEDGRCRAAPRVVPETAVDGPPAEAGEATTADSPLAGAVAVLTALVAVAVAVADAGSDTCAVAGSTVAGEDAAAGRGADGLP
jgi:hypothetical protein